MDISLLTLADLYELRRQVEMRISLFETQQKELAEVERKNDIARREQNAIVMFPVTLNQWNDLKRGNLKERLAKFQKMFPAGSMSDFAHWNNGNNKRFL